jgi:hypothetical protein
LRSGINLLNIYHTYMGAHLSGIQGSDHYPIEIGLDFIVAEG